MWYFDFRELPALPDDFALRKRAESQAAEELLYSMYRTYFGATVPPLAREASGKPYFDAVGAPHFSLSHDGSVVACVLNTDAPVGLDVCLVRTDAFVRGAYRHVLRRVYTEMEQREVEEGEDDAARAFRFFCIWSQKEAVTKRTGEGLFGMPPLSKTQPDTSGVTTFTCKMQTGVYIFSISDAERNVKMKKTDN